MSRKISVVTGSRADYGLLYPLLEKISTDEKLELQLIVTGMHLSPRHGNTYQQILDDGFTIDAKIDLELQGDTPKDIAYAIASGITSFTKAFATLNPDIIIVLGDRYEILAAVQAAMISGFPVAHIHGGEASEGAMDEAIRHSITKMSQVHFTAAEPYRQRVIQLGELPNHVFNVGALAVDNIRNMPLLDKNELEWEIEFTFGQLNFLVTYHPVTLDEKSSVSGIKNLLVALDRFPAASIIFTRANADIGGNGINQLIDDYVSSNIDHSIAFDALGSLRYLSVVKCVDAVIGNSSSGLIEVPIMKTATVNIGIRQRGRLRVPSVIDTSTETDAIVAGIDQAISEPFKQRLKETSCIYGEGNTAGKICDVLANIPLEGLLKKRFYDLPEAKV